MCYDGRNTSSRENSGSKRKARQPQAKAPSLYCCREKRRTRRFGGASEGAGPEYLSGAASDEQQTATELAEKAEGAEGGARGEHSQSFVSVLGH